MISAPDRAYGFCHRFPPTQYNLWPTISLDAWCGEFTAAFPTPPTGALSGAPLVISQTPGTLRNNWTGPVGFSFVTAVNATCTELGVWVVAGNSESPIVALCDSSGNVLAYATVTTAGASPGAYTYAPLSTPFQMTAGTTYFLVRQASYNGDQWYDANTAVELSEEAGSAASPVYASGTLISAASGWTTPGGQGVSYGPVNLLYTVP